jgi:ribosomal protein S8
LSSTDTDAYDNLVLAVNAASTGARSEKFGYGPNSIIPIQMSKLLKKESYVQSFTKVQSDQPAVMVPLLRQMRENLGNTAYDNALEVLVTSTWYDNADYYQLRKDVNNDIVQ